MTTKQSYKMLPYDWQGEIDYASLEFNPDDPEPLPDAMIQNPYLFDFIPILVSRFGAYRRPDFFIESNTFICYDRRNLNVRVGPDCYLAFGVDARVIRQRRLYLPWEVGKPPDLAIEVASVTTARHDITGKRDIYAQIGIPEYWRFDPTGGELYGAALAGERLVEGEYQPFPLTTEPDGVLKGYSPMLALSFCWDAERLLLYDPKTGEYLSNIDQLHIALEEAQHREEAALHREEVALRREQEAQAAREAAEVGVRELEEKLRRQP